MKNYLKPTFLQIKLGDNVRDVLSTSNPVDILDLDTDMGDINNWFS